MTHTAPCDHCKTPTEYHGLRPVGLLLCPACEREFHASQPERA